MKSAWLCCCSLMGLVYPCNFHKSGSYANAPPYPSESFYEAKLWQFCRKQGAKGALIWNVAGLCDFTAIKSVEIVLTCF